MRTLIGCNAMSLDGYISRPNDNVMVLRLIDTRIWAARATSWSATRSAAGPRELA
jgi:hypothetical protein